MMLWRNIIKATGGIGEIAPFPTGYADTRGLTLQENPEQGYKKISHGCCLDDKAQEHQSQIGMVLLMFLFIWHKAGVPITSPRIRQGSPLVYAGFRNI